MRQGKGSNRGLGSTRLGLDGSSRAALTRRDRLLYYADYYNYYHYLQDETVFASANAIAPRRPAATIAAQVAGLMLERRLTHSQLARAQRSGITRMREASTSAIARMTKLTTTISTSETKESSGNLSSQQSSGRMESRAQIYNAF